MLKNYTGSDLRHLEYQAKPGWEGSLWEDGYVHICGWIRAYMWMDACIYVDGYVHICGWIRAYMWMDTCIYVDGYVHICG